jgi:xanthine/CO dehydrogenase XdhC/CoxF family maturation factor
VIALSILASAGVTLTALVGEALRAQRAAIAEEQQILRASTVMATVALMRSNDLAMRLGDHDIGGVTVTIQRPEPGLFRVAVRDSAHQAREVLITVLHRREAQ